MSRVVAGADVRLQVVILRLPQQAERDLRMCCLLDRDDIGALHLLREEVLAMDFGEVGEPTPAPIRG